MLKRLAKCSALPGVGEATATSSASWGMIWSEVAWMSAWNWEPMMPILTLEVVAIACGSLIQGLGKKKRACEHFFDLADLGRSGAAPVHEIACAGYLGVGSSQPTNSWR